MRLISRLEQESGLDRLVSAGQRAARLIRPGRLRDMLHGIWFSAPEHFGTALDTMALAPARLALATPGRRPARKESPAAPGPPCRQHRDEAIVVSWPATACAPCPACQLCTSGRRGQITIRSRELHEALASARAEQTSAQWSPPPGRRRPASAAPTSAAGRTGRIGRILAPSVKRTPGLGAAPLLAFHPQPGSFTRVRKKSSTCRIASVNRSRLTGLVMYALACNW